MLPHGGVRISKENKGKTLDMKKRIHVRNHKLTIRLTDAEYTAISICSRQKQQTMSEYIRSELFTSKDTKMSAAASQKLYVSTIIWSAIWNLKKRREPDFQDGRKKHGSVSCNS